MPDGPQPPVSRFHCFSLGAEVRDVMALLEREINTLGNYVPDSGIVRNGINFNANRLRALMLEGRNECLVKPDSDLWDAFTRFDDTARSIRVQTSSLRDKYYALRNTLIHPPGEVPEEFA